MRADTLLAAIRAAPDDDALRLVLADHWMAEGDPRGELMRLEVELAAMHDLDPQRKLHARRISQLLEGPDRSLLLDLAAPLPKEVSVTTDRGLPAILRGGAGELAAHADELCQRFPHLQSLEVLLPQDGLLGSLASSALLARARKLRLYSGRQRRIARLEELPMLGELRALDFEGLTLGAADVDVLLARAPALEELAIRGCRLNKNALAALGIRRPDLVRIELPGAHGGPSLGAWLAHLRRLRVAELQGNGLGTTGFEALLPTLATCVDLDLRGNDLTPEHVRQLLPALQQARTLALGNNALGDEGAHLVADWSGSANLVKLHLGATNLTDAGARRLAEAPGLSGLRSLVLWGENLSAETEAALLASSYLANAAIFSGTRRLARVKR
jgi:uncharacterized protein (TIGR02996 family)